MAKLIRIVASLLFFILTVNCVPALDRNDPSLEIIKQEDAEEGYFYQIKDRSENEINTNNINAENVKRRENFIDERSPADDDENELETENYAHEEELESEIQEHIEEEETNNETDGIETNYEEIEHNNHNSIANDLESETENPPELEIKEEQRYSEDVDPFNEEQETQEQYEHNEIEEERSEEEPLEEVNEEVEEGFEESEHTEMVEEELETNNEGEEEIDTNDEAEEEIKTDDEREEEIKTNKEGEEEIETNNEVVEENETNNERDKEIETNNEVEEEIEFNDEVEEENNAEEIEEEQTVEHNVDEEINGDIYEYLEEIEHEIESDKIESAVEYDIQQAWYEVDVEVEQEEEEEGEYENEEMTMYSSWEDNELIDPPEEFDVVQMSPLEASENSVKIQEDSTCLLPPVTGPCKAYFQRYFYNFKTGECETFIYGGCEGNSNNFNDISQCESTCRWNMHS